MASASFEHVTKRYRDGDVAVKDLTLSIVDGELMVILGPSGCGKSTVLRLLAGLEDVTEGAIRIGDRVVNDIPPRNRNVSMVFQDYALYPHMNVFDNMSYGLRLQGYPSDEIRARVFTAAEGLHLSMLLGRKPRQLSGGEQQRVALGRAIVKDPLVFLFDEPLSSVDAKMRAEMRVDLKRVHRELGATFVYVTHDQVEAMTLGDRIAVLRDGVLQQVGNPLDVYNHPANVFVGGFIGAPAMNFVPVVIDGRVAKGSGLEMELRSAPDVERAVLGIRPEAMTEHVPPGTPTVEMKVDSIETLGRDQYVHGFVGDSGTTMVARIDAGARVTRGDQMRLGIDVRQTHVFDAVTGATIS